MKHPTLILLHLILVVFGFVSNAVSQENEPVPVTGIHVLTLDTINSGDVHLFNEIWKYHPGDNPEWANPDFDDTTWELANTWMPQNELPDNGWQGIGWFRLHLSISDEELRNMPLALHVTYQAGASEIYLDGELIYSFGKVGKRKEEEKPYWERNPQVISFSGETDHVIAVRYSNFASTQLTPVLGFALRFSPLNTGIKSRVTILRIGTTFQMVLTAILVFLMMQHLLLFIFYPRARENLYFSILTGSIGAFVFITFQIILVATSTPEIISLLRFFLIVSVLMSLSTLLFLYTLFYTKLPKLFWFFLTGWIITFWLSLLAMNNYISDISITNNSVVSKGLATPLLSLFMLLTSLELARVMIVAIFKRKDGAWIFGLGSLSPFILSFISGIIISRTGWNSDWNMSAYLITILAPILSMSVYLARNFSRTSRKLEREVIEREHLEVENTRKTEELEEARKLQMSMLPQAAPQLPNLNIAFEMRPATEVGGDYYDFNLSEDGQITIAIGDATGHGMNAGLVVSAVKSLFKTTTPNETDLETLERISQGIKSMQLKRLYMAMTLATFNDNKLTLAAAGMPPTLIHRASENSVEEILLEGMPLGGFVGAERQEASFELHSGDTVLLMSDGLPEMLNPKNEMLDYPKTKKLFAEIADKSPKAIINHLFSECTSWADGSPQTDDITLVVIKVK